MQLHLDEQLSRLHLSGMKQALNQQQAQSMLYLDMGFEERLQLLLSHVQGAHGRAGGGAAG